MRQHVERALDLVLAQEEVEILGVTPDAGVRLQRVRPADQGLEPLLLEEAQRLAVCLVLLLFRGAPPLRRDLHTGKVGMEGREGKQARAGDRAISAQSKPRISVRAKHVAARRTSGRDG